MGQGTRPPGDTLIPVKRALPSGSGSQGGWSGPGAPSVPTQITGLLLFFLPQGGRWLWAQKTKVIEEKQSRRVWIWTSHLRPIPTPEPELSNHGDLFPTGLCRPGAVSTLSTMLLQHVPYGQWGWLNICCRSKGLRGWMSGRLSSLPLPLSSLFLIYFFIDVWLVYNII